MRFQRTIALISLLVFFAINVTSINTRPVTLDDLDSIKHIYGLSLKESYNPVQTVQSVSLISPEHAPFYFILLNAWRMFVGDDLFLARLLSVFFGLIAVAGVYSLAKLTRNRRAALAAPLILAFIAYLQYYSQIARVYSLLLPACVWLLWSYWQIVNSASVARWKWLSLFAAAAIILYVHYFGIIVLAAIGIYHLLYVPKGRRWLRAVLVMAGASLPFTLWLPVAVRGFTRSSKSMSKLALSLPEALIDLLQIYSNGLWILPVGAAAILILNRKRLTGAEKYLTVITLTLFTLLLLINEVSPILIERRIRYTVVLALPFSCALAIAASRLPHWRVICLPLLALWIASSILFKDSHDFAVYTNWHSLDLDSIPHYQDFIYEANDLPGHNELILSFLPRATDATRMALHYYRKQLSDWKHVVHISSDAQGQARIESSLSTYMSAEAISSNSQGIWLIHNPALTNEVELATHFGWFTQRFNFCKRYVDKPESKIDFYLKSPIPCDLVTDEQPFAIRYDNGTELGNLKYDLTSNSLTVYLRWLHTIDKVYSFTLQIFDSEGSKVGQADRVISGDPIDIVTFDMASLSDGQHVVKLIVYDRESKASQPGILVDDQQPFERVVDVLRFTVPA